MTTNEEVEEGVALESTTQQKTLEEAAQKYVKAHQKYVKARQEWIEAYKKWNEAYEKLEERKLVKV